MEASFYSRVRLLPEFNGEAIKRFKDAKVLVIGAGGLGCPVLLGLNSVGLGTIGIMDGDKVDMTNLSRQILFSMEDVGRPKAQVAVEKLSKSGSDTIFVPINEYASAGNITSLIRQYDVIIDCTDNFQTRYLINDACFIENKVLVFGAVHQYEGSVSVFHYREGPTLRCLYPNQPQDNVIGGCNENGILPTVTTLIGATMANEAIKIVGSFGKVLSGKLLTINLSTLQFDTISFKKSDT
ncbi:MAG: HesA/MoeB/ThiF family protein, partial [Cytophagales bacterium]|nr:HesA/MoeB/ThiF family protein [Cytophagales bacterium]